MGRERVNVYISAPDGGEYIASISAQSSKDAMQQAVEFFMSDWWQGPGPKPGALLRIEGVYKRFCYRMRVTDEMMRIAVKRKIAR